MSARHLRVLFFVLTLMGAATVAAAGASADPGDAAAPPATSAGLKVKAIAEVETRSQAAGRDSVKLMPAERVVPGDRVLYTLEVRNTAGAALKAPTVIHPVPEHMRYIEDSAVGPGADVDYSVDGGRHFDRAASLKVPIAAGQVRAAVAADFTHIRWRFKTQLEANSVAFVRFRAVVK